MDFLTCQIRSCIVKTKKAARKSSREFLLKTRSFGLRNGPLHPSEIDFDVRHRRFLPVFGAENLEECVASPDVLQIPVKKRTKMVRARLALIALAYMNICPAS